MSNDHVLPETLTSNQLTEAAESQDINDNPSNPVNATIPMPSLEPLPISNDHGFTEPKPAPIIPEDFQILSEVIEAKFPISSTSGLGINVKGRILNDDSDSLSDRKDAGVFIKTIMPGSTADKVLLIFLLD